MGRSYESPWPVRVGGRREAVLGKLSLEKMSSSQTVRIEREEHGGIAKSQKGKTACT